MSNGDSGRRGLLGHVDRLGWILLLIILPLVLFPTPLRLLGLLIVPALWLIRRMAAGQFIPATPLNWPLFGLLLMVLVAFAVELFLPDQYGSRAQLWFGPITAMMMAVATLVETEPK